MSDETKKVDESGEKVRMQFFNMSEGLFSNLHPITVIGTHICFRRENTFFIEPKSCFFLAEHRKHTTNARTAYVGRAVRRVRPG